MATHSERGREGERERWIQDVTWPYTDGRLLACEEAQHWSSVLRLPWYCPERVPALATFDAWQDPRIAAGRRYASVQHGLTCEQLLYTLHASSSGFKRTWPLAAGSECTDVFTSVWQLHKLAASKRAQTQAHSSSCVPFPCKTAADAGFSYSVPYIWINVWIVAVEIDACKLVRFLVSDGKCMVWVWDEGLVSGKEPGESWPDYKTNWLGAMVCVNVRPWDELHEDGRVKRVLLVGSFASQGLNKTLLCSNFCMEDGSVAVLYQPHGSPGIEKQVNALAPVRDSTGKFKVMLLSTDEQARMIETNAPVFPQAAVDSSICAAHEDESVLPPPEQWQLVPAAWPDLTQQSCEVLRRASSFRGLVRLKDKPRMMHGRRDLFVLTVEDGQDETNLVLDTDTVDAWLSVESDSVADPVAVHNCLKNLPAATDGGVNGDSSALWNTLMRMFDERQGRPMLIDVTSCTPPAAYELHEVNGLARSCWVRTLDMAALTVCVGSCEVESSDAGLQNFPVLLDAMPAQARMARLLLLTTLFKMKKERADAKAADLFRGAETDAARVMAPLLTRLPSETIEKIASHLDPFAWMALALTCKHTRDSLGGADRRRLPICSVIHYLVWNNYMQRARLILSERRATHMLSAAAFEQLVARRTISESQEFSRSDANQQMMQLASVQDYMCSSTESEGSETEVSPLRPRILFPEANEGEIGAHSNEVEVEVDVASDDAEPTGPNADADGPTEEESESDSDASEVTQYWFNFNHYFDTLSYYDWHNEDTDDSVVYSVQEYDSQMLRLIFGVKVSSKIQYSRMQPELVMKYLHDAVQSQTLGLDTENMWTSVARVLERAAPLSIFSIRALGERCHGVVLDRLSNAFAWTGPHKPLGTYDRNKKIETDSTQYPGITCDSAYDALAELIEGEADVPCNILAQYFCLSLLNSAFDEPITSRQSFLDACLQHTYNDTVKWRITGVVVSVSVGQTFFVRALNNCRNDGDCQWRVAQMQNSVVTMRIFDGDMTVPVCVSTAMFDKICRQVKNQRHRYTSGQSAAIAKGSEWHEQLRHRQTHYPRQWGPHTGNQGLLPELHGAIVDMDIYEPGGLVHLYSDSLTHDIKEAIKHAAPLRYNIRMNKSLIVTMRFECEKFSLVHSGYRAMNVYRVPDNLLMRQNTEETMILAQQSSVGAVGCTNPRFPFFCG